MSRGHDAPADTAALEARLFDLGSGIDFPPTPPLAVAVRARLATTPLPRHGGWPTRTAAGVSTWPRRALAAVAVVALAAALVLGIQPVRTTVAHWLGIRGVEITPVQTLPPIPTRTPRPSETPAPPGDTLSLGVPSSLASAQQRIGFVPLVPASLGAPDAVWVRDDYGGMVTLLYLPRSGLPAAGETGVGLLVTEFRATTDVPLMQKFVGPDTTATPVTVQGQPGFWIAGAPHELGYVLPDGTGVADTLRLAAPTLVFQHGNLSVRIEGAISQQQALQIAASLR